MCIAPNDAACLNFPLPKFRIGQRVSITGVTDDTGEPYYDEGVIFGFAYNSEDSYEWGKKGWTYYLHFDIPRVLDDEADEDELVAINLTSEKSINDPL